MWQSNLSLQRSREPEETRSLLSGQLLAQGKSTTQFVKIDALAETKKHLKNYQTFKRLTEEWVELSVEIAKLRKKAEKQNSKKESS